MPERDGLMRIFWPLDIPRTDRPGIIVGWKNSPFDVLVVAILEDVEARNVENALKVAILFRSASHPISRLYELCGQPSMHVLGLVNTPTAADADPTLIHASTGSRKKSSTNSLSKSLYTSSNYVWAATTPSYAVPISKSYFIGFG